MNVNASLVLGAIDRNMVPMEQEFQIEFVQVPYLYIYFFAFCIVLCHRIF